MLLTGTWPTNMQYLTCDDYDGTNTPDRTIDLRSFFVNVKEPATYGNFSFPSGQTPFNGHAMMKFDMDIAVVSVQGGASVSTKTLGNWTAGLNSQILVKSDDDMKNFTAAIVYRVYTVVVSANEFGLISVQNCFAIELFFKKKAKQFCTTKTKLI